VLTAPSAAMMALQPGGVVQIGIKAQDLNFFAAGDTGALLQ
jgi:hypothetical protein